MRGYHVYCNYLSTTDFFAMKERKDHNKQEHLHKRMRPYCYIVMDNVPDYVFVVPARSENGKSTHNRYNTGYVHRKNERVTLDFSSAAILDKYKVPLPGTEQQIFSEVRLYWFKETHKEPKDNNWQRAILRHSVALSDPTKDPVYKSKKDEDTYDEMNYKLKQSLRNIRVFDKFIREQEEEIVEAAFVYLSRMQGQMNNQTRNEVVYGHQCLRFYEKEFKAYDSAIDHYILHEKGNKIRVDKQFNMTPKRERTMVSPVEEVKPFVRKPYTGR